MMTYATSCRRRDPDGCGHYMFSCPINSDPGISDCLPSLLQLACLRTAAFFAIPEVSSVVPPTKILRTAVGESVLRHQYHDDRS